MVIQILKNITQHVLDEKYSEKSDNGRVREIQIAKIIYKLTIICIRIKW